MKNIGLSNDYLYDLLNSYCKLSFSLQRAFLFLAIISTLVVSRHDIVFLSTLSLFFALISTSPFFSFWRWGCSVAPTHRSIWSGLGLSYINVRSQTAFFSRFQHRSRNELVYQLSNSLDRNCSLPLMRIKIKNTLDL